MEGVDVELKQFGLMLLQVEVEEVVLKLLP
jgi:hypothetical protein